MINFNKNQGGAAMLFFVIFFTIATSALLFLLSRSLYSDLYAVSSLQSSKQAYITAESALEDRVFKMMDTGSFPQTSTSFSAMTGDANVKVNYNSASDTYTVISTSTVGRTSKVSVVELSLGAGTAFNYGVQSGNGGFELRNNAEIIGNVFSNGSVTGSSNWIYGDVISASTTGMVDNVHATGSVWTNILKDSMVDKDAYFNSAVGINNVSGASITPLSPFPSAAPLPLTDEEIDVWKTGIQETGLTIPSGMSECQTGTYTISSDVTIGNLKIECNLKVSGPQTNVTLTGPVWVTGSFEVGGADFSVSSSLNKKNTQIIVDGKITTANNSDFIGYGNPSSHIMLLSQNNSAETGGGDPAIYVTNSLSGDVILYAMHGLIHISNNGDFTSLAAYKILIENGASVSYDSGVASALFTGGPGGGYVISDWYQE